AVRIATVRERRVGETRVALVPDGVQRLVRGGHVVAVEAGAGAAAGWPDAEYRERGAEVQAGAAEVAGGADVLVKVHPPEPEQVDALRAGAAVVSMLQPLQDLDLVARLRDRGVTVLALDALPRIARAQSMDVLSSMSTVAGYRAAVLAAQRSGRLFPLLMTAAGTVAPARVLVVGAGVAGLQAVATARRLGAQVEAFDTRPAVREEVESLGARFVEIELGEGGADEAGYARPLGEEGERREREALAGPLRAADGVIMTALVPGRPAPRILTAEMVGGMKRGAVIVDAAAPAGGNCERTRPGETVEHDGVTIIGPLNLPATMPEPASRMFCRNVVAFLELLLPGGELRPDLDDEILDACCITHQGSVRHEAARRALAERES
ncbi:MAG: Re/Si-specific NAD(P)(+) transhydrogenase subunit alpha, partial [Planctomycetota bacterium]